MKRFMTKLCLTFFAAMLVLAAGAGMVWADSTTEVKVSVRYGQSEARDMLKLINDFRAGKEAWVWNQDNQTKTVYKNLKPLTYDYELEKTAMLRAAEIALYYNHTRPNGTLCFTAFEGSYYALAENIAAGYPSGESVFEGWKETNENYAGQGHRRAMLSPDYTALGIGHVYYNGCHYWVQEFRSPTGTAPETKAVDGNQLTEIEILNSNIIGAQLTTNAKNCTVSQGASVSLPTVSTSIQTSGAWPGGWLSVKGTVNWRIGDSSVASVEGGKLNGLKEGKTTLTASFMGKSLSLPVTVKEGTSSQPGEEKPDITGTVPKITKITFNYSSAALSWNKMEGADGYVIYTLEAPKGKTVRKNVGNVSSATLKGLKTGRTYAIRIRAYQKTDGKVLYSKYSSVKKIQPALTVPGISSVKKSGTNRVNLTLKQVAGASGYEIYYSASKKGKYQKAGTITNNRTKTFVHKSTSLKKGSTACYKVRAYRVVEGKKVYSKYSPIASVLLS